MEAIKDALNQFKLTSKQHSDFMDIYNIALKENIPYPFMFALSKVLL
jgi:hypothetical protein